MSYPRYVEPTNEEPFQTLRLILDRDHAVAEFQSYLGSHIGPQQLAGAARYVLDSLVYHETLRHTVSVRAQQMGVIQWIWCIPERRFDPAYGDESTVLELMFTMYSTIQSVRADIWRLYDQIEQYEQRQRALGHSRGGDGNQGGPSYEIIENRRGYSNQDDSYRGGASHPMNRNWRENWRGSSDQDESNRAGPSHEVNGSQPGPPRQVNGDQPGYSCQGHVNENAPIPGPAASHRRDEHGRGDPGPA